MFNSFFFFFLLRTYHYMKRWLWLVWIWETKFLFTKCKSFLFIISNYYFPKTKQSFQTSLDMIDCCNKKVFTKKIIKHYFYFQILFLNTISQNGIRIYIPKILNTTTAWLCSYYIFQNIFLREKRIYIVCTIGRLTSSIVSNKEIEEWASAWARP